MKTIVRTLLGSLTLRMGAAGVLLAGLAMAEPAPPAQSHPVVVAVGGAGQADEDLNPGKPGALPKSFKIQFIEPSGGKEPRREVTWLGLSTAETPAALAAQLGLKAGQGLVVIYVAPDSPAAEAGLQKYDVLVELDDQLLVDPAQLRKLIQMRKEGDPIKLTLHRGGKKQTVNGTLGKRTEAAGLWLDEQSTGGDQTATAFALAAKQAAESAREGARESVKWLHESLAQAGIDKEKLKVEVQRNIDEVRKAIEESLRHSNHALGAGAKEMEALARGKVDVEDGATVTVTKDGASVKSIVKSDDEGVIVIVASPKKHLTAHDKEGKLLFDGPIETPEEQRKVPAELWEKVEPLLPQIKPADDAGPKPRAQSEEESKS